MDRITSPFGFSSTAAEVAEGRDLTGKRVIITGGASGIGIETARAIAGIGAEVTLAVRDPAAAAAVAEELWTSTGNENIHVGWLDLADRDSVKEFVFDWSGQVDVLVNNAAVMALPDLQRTPDRWEMHFATNHLGHFALAQGLHRYLAEAGNARIVSVGANGHLFSPVLFDDLHFDFVPYDPFIAYGQSKTATTLFAIAATAHWAADGITANAVLPGAIPTRLQRHSGGLLAPAARAKSPQQGAATTVFAATSPLLEGIGGLCLEDSAEAQVVTHRNQNYSGVAPYAIDPGNAERLWQMSLDLMG